MSDLVSLAGKELLTAPRCPSPFYTPSGAFFKGKIDDLPCPMSARGGPSCGSISNDTTMDCWTPRPNSWQVGFVGAHVVRRSNLPPTNTSFATHTEKRWWEDGGLAATSNGQGWLLQRADGDFYVTLGGTCGAFCSIAAAVASYLREPHVQRRFGPLDSLAVLDIGGGTSSFDACISSVQGVGVTLALTPWEASSDDTPLIGEYYQQTWISVERGAPLLEGVLYQKSRFYSRVRMGKRIWQRVPHRRWRSSPFSLVLARGAANTEARRLLLRRAGLAQHGRCPAQHVAVLHGPRERHGADHDPLLCPPTVEDLPAPDAYLSPAAAQGVHARRRARLPDRNRRRGRRDVRDARPLAKARRRRRGLHSRRPMGGARRGDDAVAARRLPRRDGRAAGAGRAERLPAANTSAPPSRADPLGVH